MKHNITSAAIAHFMCYNRFAFSPHSVLQIVKYAPKAKFIRPLSYWLTNGYAVDDNANKINVPLPHVDFFFLRQNQKTSIQLATQEEKEKLYADAELLEEICYIDFPFYDVASTNCKVRLPKYDLESDKLYLLAQQLSLSIDYQPLHKLFLNSYICDKIIVLPTTNCKLNTTLLLKHIAYYILSVTSTQVEEIMQLEFFLMQVMLNAAIKEKIPIYNVPLTDQLSEEQLITSLTRVSKLVAFLFTQLNIDIKATDSMELSYMLERKPVTSTSSNAKKFKGRKQIKK